MSDSTAEQDRIEANLRKTRSRMDSRLSELQEKLQPSQLVGDFMDYIRGNGGAEFAQNLMASVQKNPLPAVVAGAGLAWLIAANFRPETATVSTQSRQRTPGSSSISHSSADYYDLQRRLHEAEANVAYTTDTDTDTTYRDRLDEARGNVLGVARHAQDTAATYAQRIQAALSTAKQGFIQTAHEMRDHVSDGVEQAGNAASQMSGAAHDTMQQMGSAASAAAGQFKQSAQQLGGTLAQGATTAQQRATEAVSKLAENPMALAAVGFAAGAVIALLLPKTQQEQAVLGDAAEQLRQTVQETAQNVVDQGTEILQNVADTAKDSAEAHGFNTAKPLNEVVADLKSGDVIENAKQVVRDVLNVDGKAQQKI